MEDKLKFNKAYKAIILLMFITITISLYEFFTALKNFDVNGNIFDFCSGAVEYIPYFMIFLLVLFIALPFALILFKENNISIKDAIYNKKTLFKDILFGIILGIISAGCAYPFSLMRTFGSSYEHIIIYNEGITTYILGIISLSIVCGCLKELYFRGFAKFFLADSLGEKLSYIMTAILFGIVDWQNMGSSIILGLLWAWAYKKNGRLIVPMVAHGMINLIGFVWMIVF